MDRRTHSAVGRYRKRRGTLRKRRGPGMGLKFLLLLLVLAVLLVLMISGLRSIRRMQPEGRYISVQEALNLVFALQDSLRDAPQMEAVRQLEAELADPKAALTFGQFKLLEDGLGMPGPPELAKTYKEEFALLASDFFAYYEKALEKYDVEKKISRQQLLLLGTQEAVTDQDGAELPEGGMLAVRTESGRAAVYVSGAAVLTDMLYRPAVFWVKDGMLLAGEGGSLPPEGAEPGQAQAGGASYTLKNAWIVEALETGVHFFYQGYHVTAPVSAEAAGAAAGGKAAEQVADVSFDGGQVNAVALKLEKVTGRLLRVTEEQLELEGTGEYPLSRGSFPVYQVYGGVSSLEPGELRLGYDFTDFVLEDGYIAAAVVVRDEAMENVRVLIKSSDYGAAFHDSVEFRCDVDAVLTFGDRSETVPAGETRRISMDGDYFEGADRVVLTPQALSARTELLNVKRSQGAPSCRGVLELKRTGDGILLINELLLEEYLYAVVPSEMPASYPAEALKAQAICARTYAYKRMQRAGLAKYGAHVDDSAGFQVYNNIAENAAATQAVRETKGQVLSFGGELADTYYYSTSCGFGTDLSVWKSADPATAPYLAAARISAGAQGPGPEQMQDEEAFAAYIGKAWPEDYESGEGWYRWHYEVPKPDPATVLKNLQNRYAAGPHTVLTQQSDGSFAREPVEKLGRIKQITVAHRSAGGAVDELLIEGEKRTYRIMTELAVRYALFDPSVPVIKQDGKEVTGFSMLPSAYFTVNAFQKNGSVIGYELTGGGFGHGVGMSQNGARNMAAAGMTGEEILTFFYRDCGVKTVY